MSSVTLVIGGCRSGKSAHAQALAEAFPPSRLYLATCPVTDDEIAARIACHRKAREGRGWITVEEEIDLVSVLTRQTEHNVALIDCVTLWINNLLYRAQCQGTTVEEPEIAQRCQTLLEAARASRAAVIMVTNEVGMGIVPDNSQTRRYRDLVGRANQTLAAQADNVTLVSCGIPLRLKQQPPGSLSPETPSQHRSFRE